MGRSGNDGLLFLTGMIFLLADLINYFDEQIWKWTVVFDRPDISSSRSDKFVQVVLGSLNHF